MKIGPLSMAVVLIGLGFMMAKQNIDFVKKKVLKKVENKIKQKNEYQNIDF